MSHTLYTLTHGMTGIELGYAITLTAIVAGLLHGRASWTKFLLAPLIAVPTLLLSSLVTAMTSLLGPSGVSQGILLQIGFGVIQFIAIGYFAGRILAANRGASTNPVHRRGATVTSAVPISRQRDGITLADVPIPLEDETKHFKLIGTTGTGKSTAIRELLGGALTRGDRAIIADPDGGYLNRFYDPSRGDIILNPFDAEARKWNLFDEIVNEYDINQLARSLIPNSGDPDRIWSDFARTFFTSVTKQALRAGKTDDRELFRLLTAASRDELRTMLAGTPAGPFLDEGNEKMFGSLRSVATSAVQALEFTTQHPGQPFSVRHWVRDGAARHAGGPGGILFIPYTAGQIAALRSIISAWLRLAIFEAMDRGEGDQRLWFIIDELDALGEIDGLKDALVRLRKYGCRCVLGLQAIAQMSGAYGKSTADTIVENCSNTVVFRCSASEHGGTSEFASKLIGQREVLHTTVSRSRKAFQWLASTTTSQHLKIEPAIMASEIERLPDLTAFLKLASVPDWQLVRLTPRNEPGVARPARPQAYQRSSHQAHAPVPPGAAVGVTPPTPAAAQAFRNPPVPPVAPVPTDAPGLIAPPAATSRSRKSRGARAVAPKRPRQPKTPSQRLPISPATAADALPAPSQVTAPTPGDGSIPSAAGGADSKN